MKVIVDAEYNPYSIDPEQIVEIAEFALMNSNAPKSSEVSITFVNNEEMASLNEQYRGLSGPTDVLSFECDNLDDGFPKAEMSNDHILGDIIIAPEVAMKQAQEYETGIEAEMDLLCVHGILHLQGFDHIDDEDAKEMEALQEEILTKWRSREDRNA